MKLKYISTLILRLKSCRMAIINKIVEIKVTNANLTKILWNGYNK